MLKPRLWKSAILRIAVFSVMVSVALMPGTVRGVVVHVHDHGQHEHQQPLFITSFAAAEHHQHDDDHHLAGSPANEHAPVVDSRIIGEAVTLQSSHGMPPLIALPMMVFSAIDFRGPEAFALLTWRSQALSSSSSCVSRIVHTSHALLL